LKTPNAGDANRESPAGWSVITERLRLEPIGVDHVAELERLYSGPDVSYWTGPWTRAGIQEWANDMQERWLRNGVGKWMAYRLRDDQLVGRGGLSWIEIRGEAQLEVGWVISEQHRHEGYATEIGRASLNYAFSRLAAEEVVAFTETHNHASRAVMTRLDMTPDGVIYRPGLIEGSDHVHDNAPFALYRIKRHHSSSERRTCSQA